MTSQLILTPVQQTAANGLADGIRAGGILVLRGRPGTGKTTILEQLHAAHGGALVGARQFMEASLLPGQDAIEDTFLRMMEDAVANHDLVMVDDLHLVMKVVEGYNYDRTLLFDAAVTAILGGIRSSRKTAIFAVEEKAPWPVEHRACAWEIAG